MKYAGIGSRSAGIGPCELLRKIAYNLAQKNVECHTGGALGADKAFIDGTDMAGKEAQLWLPWQGYNGYTSDTPELTDKHIEFTKKYHPKWESCSSGAKKMHARNAQILLGNELTDPVDFVVCWTPDGKLSGGTAQGLRIAIDYDIPIFNLGKGPGTLTRLKEFLKTKSINI